MNAGKIRLSKILSFILAVLFFVSAISVCDFSARAEGAKYPFDNTEVLEDLESSREFNLSDYFWDVYGLYRSPEIVNFVEWCYSPFKPDDFALYIYLYNPQGVDFDEDNPSNRIQMASNYSSFPITRDSVPTNYDTYPLVFCNASTLENYEGMFYKFRVVDEKGADGLYIQDRVYSGERRYDVSGLVLADESGDVKEYGVGGTYFFNGYASGYGPNENAESTLESTGFQPLETISLEVHPTVYRQKGFSNLGDGHQWDINSVYFSVPERYFTEYGDLQKIKAEWWEYETQPILVCDNVDAVNAFKQYLGVNIGDEIDGLEYRFTNRTTDSGGHVVMQDFEGFTYNVNKNANNYDGVKRLNTLYYAIHNDVDKNLILRGELLTEYMKNYTASTAKGYLPVLIDGQKISADLFTDVLSNGRADIAHADNDIHHKIVEFDANDKFNMLAFDANDSSFLQFIRKIFGSGTAGDTEKNITPILSDCKNYINMSDSNMANGLLINAEDAVKFKSFYSNAQDNNERTVLFRFAMTDYYSSRVNIYKDTTVLGATSPYNDCGDGQVSTESVFLDFKIIHLTFQKAGTYKVIPVTQDPINIINDLTKTPGPEAPDWWKQFVNWITDLLKTIGAWGALAVGVGAIVLLAILTIKLLQLAQGVRNTVFRIIFIVVILIATIYLGVVIGKFFGGIITGLGGLW